MSEYEIQSRIQYARERVERIAGDYRAAQGSAAYAEARDSSERPERQAASAWWRRRRSAEAPAYRP